MATVTDVPARLSHSRCEGDLARARQAYVDDHLDCDQLEEAITFILLGGLFSNFLIQKKIYGGREASRSLVPCGCDECDREHRNAHA